jgi:hypothetical protein
MHLGFFFHDCNPFYHTHFCGLLLIPIFSTMVKSMSLSWLHNHVVVFAWNDYIFLVINLTFCSSVVLFNTYIHRGCGICEKIIWRSCWSIYYRIQGQFLVYNFFFSHVDAFDIVYPQCSLQLEPKAKFVVHLAILKYVFADLKIYMLNDLWVPKPFSTISFNLQNLCLSLPWRVIQS